MSRPDAISTGITEIIWQSLIVMLTTWSLLAVALAQAGLFRAWALLAAALIAGAAGLGFWWIQRPAVRRVARREAVFLALIFLAGLLLYAWPAEHYPLLGDSAIYPNTAARLIRDRGLTYHYVPLDGLSAEQKTQFYIPAARQVGYEPIESYDGLLFGAYYLIDPRGNEIVASRPPVLIAWMGLFGKLFGIPGMLYVTPLFGALSLVMLYFLGQRVFDRRTGALAAFWLLLSFLQLHFSRTPYAEVVGQLFVLAMLYALTVYLQTRRIAFLALGSAALAAGFGARLDAILVLPALIFFVLILVRRNDKRGLVIGLLSLAAAAGFTLWTVNRPYVGATAELLLAGQLHQLTVPAVRAALGAGAFLGLALTLLAVCRMPTRPWLRIVRGGLIVLLIAGVGYALHIRPLMPEYTWARGQLLPTHNEEIMAVAARYVSVLLFWLAAVGAGVVLWRRRIFSEPTLLVVFVASLAGVVFWKYTTARVYPVALRRLLPEVLPGIMLLGAFALSWLARRGRWRPAAAALAGLVAALQIGVSGQYWFYREAPGTWDFTAALAARLPPEAVVLFEPQAGDSIVGWFAAPLWSIYDRRALLLNKGELDGRALHDALCRWQGADRDVYVVAQRDPAQWWPGMFAGTLENRMDWNSSIIGQSLLFPPYVWRFSVPFSIYQLTPVSCAI